MQRHPAQNDNDEENLNPTPPHEGLPLRHHHMSFQESESFYDHEWRSWNKQPVNLRRAAVLVAVTVVILLLVVAATLPRRPRIVPIQHASEHYVDIGNGLSLWYRIWGNQESGIPVLFVHGGPGNCIADYGYGNAKFFDKTKFFVVEVDQRGTGNSLPSVQDDCRNMKYYTNITIEQMSHDYELVREDLKIDRWLVFGGSWGSTLSLDYVERYPKRCLGLILRGIWLNTRPEFDAIFIRRAYLDNAKRLSEFDTWFELAAQDVLDAGEPKLDPNDGERFFRINERMILNCNENAIWRHFVWENNMMEEDSAYLLDPFNIDYDILPEAMSVAFFENQIFLHGTFDEPMDLLQSVERLKPVQTWMCQGLRDEVCPTKYGAEKLATALVDAGVSTRMQFLDAGHEDTDPVIARCLQDSVADFLSKVGMMG